MKAYLIVAAERFSTIGINFLSLVILARFLTPQEFGAAAIASVFISVSTVLVDFGFGGALIYEKEASKKDYQTVFIINLVFSVFIFLAFIILSPYVGTFYDNDSISDLITIGATSMVVRAISLTSVVKLTKSHRFLEQAVVNLLSGLIGLGLSVWLAMNGFGAFSIVYQQVAASIVFALSILFVAKEFPGFGFSVSSFRKMWGFGYKLTFSSLIKSIHQNSAAPILGTAVGLHTVGNFNQGNRLNNIYTTFFYSVIDKVAFPVLSSCRDEEEKCLDQVGKIISVVMGLSLYVNLIMATFSYELVGVVLGNGWEDAARYLFILSFSAPALVLASVNRVVLKSFGLSGDILSIEIVKAIVVVSSLLVIARIKVEWFAWVLVVTAYFSCVLMMYYVNIRTYISASYQFKSMIFPGIGALFFMPTLLAVKLNFQGVYGAFIGAFLGLIIMAIAYFIAKRAE